MRARKVGSVMLFELIATFKRKGYLIATFGMPLILGAYGAFVFGMGFLIGSESGGEPRLYGLVDRAGMAALDGEIRAAPLPEELENALRSSGNPAADLLEMGSVTLRAYATEDAARSAVIEGELSGYFLIPEDWLERGVVERYVAESLSFDFGNAGDAVRQLLRDRLLEVAAAPEMHARLRAPVARFEGYTLAADGTLVETGVPAIVLRMVVPLAFVVLLFVSLMMNTAYLVQGLAEEKENKVVEVLLAAANPDEILAGKLIGLGIAGLFQILVWFSMLFAAGLVFAGMLAGFGVALPWTTLGVAVPFFVAAYLFFGAMMLATGSLGGSSKEAQQYSGLWGLLAAIPLMFMGLLWQDPHGTLARIFSWIPLTAPVTVVLRQAIEPEGMAWWEIAGPFALLLAAIWLALRIGGRLFRLGLLSGGTRPAWRTIWRQARLG